MLNSHYNEPFSFETLLSLPTLPTHPSAVWQALDLDEYHSGGIFKQSESKLQNLQELHAEFFPLQALDVPLPEIESASVSDVEDISATDTIPKNDTFEYDEDIWTLPDVSRPHISSALTSWDHFLQPSHVEPKAAYLSEAGPAAFDAARGQALSQIGRHLPLKIARPDKVIFALFELGCGRQSGLFQWQTSERTFKQRSKEFGLLGISQNVQDAVIAGFNATGSLIKDLTDFAEEEAALADSQRLLIAFSYAISVALNAVMRFVEREQHNVRSLPQLQELFHKPRLLLEGLDRLVKIASSRAQASDVIVELINVAQQLSNGAVWLEDILSQIVVRAAAPWLSDIASIVGLSSPAISVSTMHDSGEALGHASSTTLTYLSPVLSPELSNLVMDCETSLQLLQVEKPDHPLLTNREADQWPSLSWECTWESIETLQSRANQYEERLRIAIDSSSKGFLEPEYKTEPATTMLPNGNHDPQGLETGLINLDLPAQWNQHLGLWQGMESDRLEELVSESLSTEEGCSLLLAPPLGETLTLSISPLLKAQHRLLSCSVLHLLFKEHEFRSHLRLHHQFQLLGDGSFASRLSQALFDPDQSSGEGRRKGQGKTGLRLQTRETWPPASSELRLVLMGILTESFGAEHAGTLEGGDQKLSDVMSFAIRDLSDVELEKCRDADSIYALDFLRLQYKPPTTLLEVVLTSSSQKKYDRIFMHLLRLLRVRSVALSLLRSVTGRNCRVASRSNHKFRIEMHFFASTLAEYSTNVAIRAPWTRLEGLVDKVEKRLDRNDFEGAIAVAGSLRHLKEKHDGALDSMLRALGLDKKQMQVRALLEDVFGLILRFAAMVRNDDDDATSNEHNDKGRMMYEEFRRLVGRFTRYLQAQSDASTSAGALGNEEAVAFEQLHLKLNMFGYYG